MAENSIDNCNYLLPKRAHPPFRMENNEIYACLLPENHAGNHLIQLNTGQFIAWYPDEEPHDEEHEPGEHCDCFIWEPISTEEAQKILPTTPHKK